LGWHSTIGTVALDRKITRQAATISCRDDFLFMMWVTVLSAPLIFLLKQPDSPVGTGTDVKSSN